MTDHHTLDEPVEIAKTWKSARNRNNTIVLAFKKYEGHVFLDCRLFITNAEGKSVPTAKGVTVGIARVPDFVDAVAKILPKARELGLIDDDAKVGE